MGKVIILEGPDGGGKTTLAKKLTEVGWVYQHEGPPPDNCDLVLYYLMKLYQQLESSENTVNDRFHLGEVVYGHVMRNNDRLGMNGVMLFERLAKSKPIFQYLCMPPDDILWANFEIKLKESSDYVKSWDNFNRICGLYKVVTGALKWSTYNYINHTPAMVLNDVYPPDFNDYMTNKYLPAGAIGSLEAEVLFIGDVPNHPWIDIPFFSLKGSSDYLNQAIYQANLTENKIALSNAFSPEGRTHDLFLLLSCLPKLKVIFVMGSVAQHWFSQKFKDVGTQLSGIVAIPIPHPAFLKRFKGHNPAVMAEIIVEKLNGVNYPRS